jgi:hypothetical protein
MSRDNCVFFSVAQAFTPVGRTSRHPPFFPFGPLKGARRKKGDGVTSLSAGVNAWATEKCAPASIGSRCATSCHKHNLPDAA